MIMSSCISGSSLETAPGSAVLPDNVVFFSEIVEDIEGRSVTTVDWSVVGVVDDISVVIVGVRVGLDGFVVENVAGSVGGKVGGKVVGVGTGDDVDDVDDDDDDEDDEDDAVVLVELVIDLQIPTCPCHALSTQNIVVDSAGTILKPGLHP